MIVGMQDVSRAFEQLGNADMLRCTEQAIKLVQMTAKNLCPVHDGELRDSIYTDTDWSGGHILATCYTDKEYSMYVEFGTGPKGQANHEGVSPDVAVAYTQSPWWIHESQIDRRTAETYHWFYVDTPRGRFYQCTGQRAQPYMYPALKNNEEKITAIYDDAIRRKL